MPSARRTAAPCATSLKLYRVIPDAWADGLRSWCEAASRAALGSGAEAWLVTAHRGAARWIRREAMREGLSLAGIRFLDPAMLREWLCARCGVEEIARGDETAAFVLTVAAQRFADDPAAAAVAREPASCLAAMSELHSAGWTSAELDLPAKAARGFHAALARSGAWKAETDRILREREAPENSLPLRSCVVGWDAERWDDLPLLEALAAHSAECTVFAAMPRVAAENVAQLWIETIEARLHATRAVCHPCERFHPANDALVSHLEKNALATGAAAPVLLVGQDWRDQIPLVRDDVLAWLSSENRAAHSRLAIIAPEHSASSAAIIHALARAGVAALDDIGEVRQPDVSTQIAAAAARYHLQSHDVCVLLEICKLLHEALPETWRYLHPAKVHGALTDAFCTVQSRNARLLVTDDLAQWRQIGEVVASLGKWEGAMTWAGARAKWAHMMAQLGVSVDVAEPLWSRAEKLFQEEQISARAFLEYLAALLSGREIRRAPDAAFTPASVVVTTLAGAQNQTWDRVVFLDSVEGAWPQTHGENPLLDDAARAALNARRRARGLLLTSGDRWALEQARLLDLIEHCTGAIVFAGFARDPENAAREMQPNEFVLRCLSASGSAKSPLAQWRETARGCAAEPATMPTDEQAHLEKVHAARRDPAAPFDRYLFDFHESRIQPGAWPATRLDLALTCPATFALREIFHAEAVQGSGFQRGEGSAVGAHAHAWLARALGGGEELQPFRPQAAREALEREIAATRRMMRAQFAREGLALPLWWETCLRKAAWAARRCLAPLAAEFETGWFFAMEKTLRESVDTAAGALELKGRVDLLLADSAALENARLVIVDFKTGKSDAPSLTTLARGSGWQFAAYFLMGKNLTAREVAAGIIRPGGVNLAVFADADESSLREAAAPLARMQRGLCFGRRGPLVTEFGACERLPLATTPANPETLEQKAALFFSQP